MKYYPDPHFSTKPLIKQMKHDEYHTPWIKNCVQIDLLNCATIIVNLLLIALYLILEKTSWIEIMRKEWTGQLTVFIMLFMMGKLFSQSLDCEESGWIRRAGIRSRESDTKCDSLKSNDVHLRYIDSLPSCLLLNVWYCMLSVDHQGRSVGTKRAISCLATN